MRTPKTIEVLISPVDDVVVEFFSDLGMARFQDPLLIVPVKR
jgi:hypothetical protein